jgi:polyribonucleotide 5'-hydroxyl-kinase
MITTNNQPKIFNLPKEHELRFEVDFDNIINIKLLDGTAECFGTELAQFKEYTFTRTKLAIFTWHGCVIELSGQCHSYIANETPMIYYLNLYNAIEEQRSIAKKKELLGPRVMLVGPTDSGKTSLSKLFLGWSARQGYSPIFVDLDIGQGSITIPGMLSQVSITLPIPLGQEEFSNNQPLVYFYGHVTPSENVKLYKLQIAHLSNDLNKKFEKDINAKYSGIIINTCGWVDGLGYELLLYSINTFQVDIVLVIDHERLFSDLKQEYTNKNIRVMKLMKSGGVVTRDSNYRRKCRMMRIREYFYGISNNLCPHQFILDFRDVVIFKIGGGPQAPQSALPIGAQPTVDPVRLIEIIPGSEIVHSILGVSHAKIQEDILNTNIAGFLYVTEVNLERRKITVLAPCAGQLPSKYLILGSLKWLE